MVEPERRQPGYILWAHLEAFGTELVQRGVHVDRVPENDDVYHEAERAKLVLLAFAIALAQLAAFAMKHDARELMPSLAAVELDQDAPPVCLVIDEPKGSVANLAAVGLDWFARGRARSGVGLQGASLRG